ncbi:MAG: chemotaxis protein [Helicobacteraceae bacterium]|jgi:uncharacterized phage infection (PIP) family protein YhgE|nr:chemotaxis protein [Helicobacteraceae bacterium]
MTQEELDAMMKGDFDENLISDSGKEDAKVDDYRVKANLSWPPPPPSDEHRVVHQLDDVAREGEEKSSQIFDILEAIGNDAQQAESRCKRLEEGLSAIEVSFSKLHKRFPQIKEFECQLERVAQLKTVNAELTQIVQKTNDQSFTAMDVMQFQDIHRQKIERVINVMRALSHYMNSLFDTNVADEKRVSSAVHIIGDSNDDVVDEEDIEALIAAFGGKK